MSDIQEEIKIAHKKALEQDFNEIIKELKKEENKNLELSMRINKAIEYTENNVDEWFSAVELISILKGDNK